MSRIEILTIQEEIRKNKSKQLLFVNSGKIEEAQKYGKKVKKLEAKLKLLEIHK